MIFNKVVHQNHQLEDLYTIVLDGRWAFDKACELISAVTSSTRKPFPSHLARMRAVPAGFSYRFVLANRGGMWYTIKENAE